MEFSSAEILGLGSRVVLGLGPRRVSFIAHLMQRVTKKFGNFTYTENVGENMILVSISRKELTDRGACTDGLRIFDDLVRIQGQIKDTWSFRWSPLAAVWLSVWQPRHSAWLREQGLIPATNLSGADLSGADLSGASLYGASLYGADLSGADLSGASLYGASLYGASLYGADLSGASLYGANLSGANLYGAYRPSDPPEGWKIQDGILVRS